MGVFRDPKVEGGYRDRQHGDRINLLLFFENKESNLEIWLCIPTWPESKNDCPGEGQ
jgi:hypothetical protein